MNYEETLTYYRRQKVRTVLQEKYYRNYGANRETRKLFEEYATDIVRYFLKVFMCYKNTCLSEKDVDIFCEYLFNDGQTISSLAAEYRDTEQAVREIIPEYERKLRYAFNYRNDYVCEIDSVLCKIPEEGLIHFVAYGFLAQYSRRTSVFILRCLFNELSDSVIAAADEVLCGVPAVRDDELEYFLSKACFPGGTLPKIDIESVETEASPVEFHGDESMFFRISQSGEIKKIIRYPKIVYYSSKNTEHTPACCLQTNNGEIILLVMIPAINMAVCYNLKRFRALHAFCKENGLGYIITDGKLNTITDIKNFKVNERVSKTLFKILGERGRITRTDVAGLRERYNFPEKAIAAFVIQNRLKFTINPYVITYDNEDYRSRR